MKFLQGDPKNEDWIWQVRILYWWVLRSQSRKQPSAIKFDILATLLTKAEGEIDIFVSEGKMDEEKHEKEKSDKTLRKFSKTDQS